MTTKQPIPDDRARQFYVHATAWDMEDAPKSSGSANARNVLAREWDAWLSAHDAKVKRDAAREALDGLYEDASQDYRIGVQGSDQGRMDAAEAVLRAVYAWMDHYPEDVTP